VIACRNAAEVAALAHGLALLAAACSKATADPAATEAGTAGHGRPANDAESSRQPLSALTQIDAWNNPLTDLRGIEEYPGCRSSALRIVRSTIFGARFATRALSGALSDNQITDVSPLLEPTQLEERMLDSPLSAASQLHGDAAQLLRVLTVLAQMSKPERGPSSRSVLAGETLVRRPSR
jgi:hypothetical protein